MVKWLNDLRSLLLNLIKEPSDGTILVRLLYIPPSPDNTRLPPDRPETGLLATDSRCSSIRIGRFGLSILMLAAPIPALNFPKRVTFDDGTSVNTFFRQNPFTHFKT
jgi:hypothetical protein